MHSRYSSARTWLAIGIIGACAVALLTGGGDALAQAKNPFNVGISEGGAVPQGGITGWIFAQQMAFERMLSSGVRAIKTDTSAVWALMGISFAYGVFHAAGPGHGKAVVASYMFANERALKRGIVISFLAAMLQGLVAIAIVGILAWVLNATSQHMKSVANLVEIASFAGIALLGLWLVWVKGRALFAALPLLKPAAGVSENSAPAATPHEHDHHGHDHHSHDHHSHDHHSHDHAHAATHDHNHEVQTLTPVLTKAHDDHKHGHEHHAHHDHAHGEPGHVHDEHCGHFHAPDPKTLGENFSWGTALATVVTAGARPCSGAILVLVFAVAQGIFLAGVAATFAMALGTALTTGALAAVAVLAKNIALRYAGQGGARGVVLIRALECAAAVAVFLLGATLFLGSAHTL